MRALSGWHGPQVGPSGTHFRVWAPHAERVRLVLEQGEGGMRREPRGWFSADAAVGHGAAYALRIDDGPERPDPASRWQPDGVHGRSRVLDPAHLTWSTDEASWRPPPLSGAVIYELHVGTFTRGRTFGAALAHLPRLAELGVTHVELLPLNAFNGEHGWGYDGVAWHAVHEPYGGPEGLAGFVDAAHGAGLAVLVDAVYNHLGPSGNYLPEFGPYLTDRYATPWGDCLNLDGPDSDEVRGFIAQAALGWMVDYHVDGLRLDAVHGLIDTSSVHLLAELSQATDRLAGLQRRPLQLIAESDRNDPATVIARPLGGQGLQGQWVDDLHHALHVALTDEREGYYGDYRGLRDVALAYRQGFLYDGRYSPVRRKTVGAPLPQHVSSARLVTCLQNHDQIGNRALGDRLTTLVQPAVLRVAIALLCAAPSTPMLFMGEEWAATTPFRYFTSHPEPELADAVRRGRAEEFADFTAFSGDDVPDPQDPATLEASTLDWEQAETTDARQRRALWTDLLALRRLPALGDGRRDLVGLLEGDDRRLGLVRGADGVGQVAVLANLGEEPWDVAPPPGVWRLLASTDDVRYGGAGRELGVTGTDDVRVLVVPATSAVLLHREG